LDLRGSDGPFVISREAGRSTSAHTSPTLGSALDAIARLAAIKPVIVSLIKASKAAVIGGLKALGLSANSALILALEGDS
jgi:hypothetical protein